MYELGALVGGLIPTFLVRGLLLLMMPKASAEAPALRYFVANFISGVIATVLYAFGSANGGPPNWAGGTLYLIPQGIWLVVDLIRLESRRIAKETLTSPEAASSSGNINGLQQGPNTSPAQPTTPSTAPTPAAPMPTTPAMSPSSQPQEASQGELLFWQSIRASIDPADFAAYIQQFPLGTFRQLALNRLVALGTKPGAQPDSAPAKSTP